MFVCMRACARTFESLSLRTNKTITVKYVFKKTAYRNFIFIFTGLQLFQPLLTKVNADG